MKRRVKYINWLVALIWLVNGLFFKVLNLVPRHEKIIVKVLGFENSEFLRVTIGILEIAMFFWIMSEIKPRIAMFTQVLIILTMNVLEFALAPELLMWGEFNFVFALMLCVLIYWNNTKKKLTNA